MKEALILSRFLRKALYVAISTGGFLWAQASIAQEGTTNAAIVAASTNWYYVDAEHGNDSYSGRWPDPRPDQLDGPFRTIQTAYAALEPGDGLYIKKGVYRETLIMDKTASELYPIVVQAFPGDEGEAIISGAREILDWQECESQAACSGNPNWQQIVYADVDFEVKQLFQANVPLRAARYPNQGWRYPTSVDASDPYTVLRDSHLQESDRSFVGSICHVKTSLWHIDQLLVQAYSRSEGRIVLKSPTRYEISPLFGYYVTHVIAEINEPGEWAYDRARGRIYAWPVADMPRSFEGTAREYGINAEVTCSYHTVRDLVVRHAVEGIFLYRTQHVTLEDNRVEYAYNSGILGFEDSDSRIVNNTISHANHAGIQNLSASENALIEGNTVYATGATNFGDDIVQRKHHR